MNVIRTTTIQVRMPLPVLLDYMRKGGCDYTPMHDDVYVRLEVTDHDDLGHQVVTLSWRES